MACLQWVGGAIGIGNNSQGFSTLATAAVGVIFGVGSCTSHQHRNLLHTTVPRRDCATASTYSPEVTIADRIKIVGVFI